MPEFTANWEMQLGEVNKDADKSIDFMRHTHDVVSDFIGKLQLAHKNIPIIKLAGCECPECGSELNLEPRNVYCSDTTCRFKIQRVVANKILADAELQVLIKNKQTGVMGGFVKKADPKVKGSKNKVFSAALELKKKDDGTYHVQFYFLSPSTIYHAQFVNRKWKPPYLVFLVPIVKNVNLLFGTLLMKKHYLTKRSEPSFKMVQQM
jgi:DNA topoisomerase-3